MRIGLPYLLVTLALLGAGPEPPGGTITGEVELIQGRDTPKRDDVYVYLEQVKRPRGKRVLPGDGKRAEIHQKGLKFEPHVLVVSAGTEVAFPNDDLVEHSVYSATPPPFDIGRSKRGGTHRFDDPDEFDIYCDLHPHMWATVKVVDSAPSHIAKVKDGRFTFTNVPPGTYKVVAWTENSPEVSERVVVTSGGSVKLTAPLHLQVVTKSECHDHMDGTRYEKYTQCPPKR